MTTKKTTIIMLALCSCGASWHPREVATPSPEHRAWVLECIARGNPMSDEEGEDLVQQCEDTARELFPEDYKKELQCIDTKTGLATSPARCPALPE